MDSSRVKAFVTAADHGSFTAAGKALGMTTSGVSQLVSALEEEFGFPLLIRKNRGVVLTKEGEMIYPEATDFLSREQAIYRIAVELSGMDAGRVSIASYSSIAAHTLPAIIKEFSEQYPAITIQLQEGTKQQIEELLENSLADLAFSTRSSNPEYSWIPFMEDRMVAVLPLDHPYAEADSYPLDALKNEVLIMQGEGDDFDAMELFRRSGIEPDVRYTTLENYTAINMVAEGLGISIMNEFITRSWKSDVAIVPIEPSAFISLGITLPSIENAPQAVREFIMFATDRLTKLNASNT